jgi:hypothetical protein
MVGGVTNAYTLYKLKYLVVWINNCTLANVLLVLLLYKYVKRRPFLSLFLYLRLRLIPSGGIVIYLYAIVCPLGCAQDLLPQKNSIPLFNSPIDVLFKSTKLLMHIPIR